MSARTSPSIPVYDRWIGSWQFRVGRRPLASQELAKRYDLQAARWTRLTDRLGYPRAYRRLLTQFLPKTAGVEEPQSLRVLDVGIGTGSFSLAFADAWDGAVDLAGIDLSASMVEIAEQRLARAGIASNVVQGNVTELPFQAARFDVVLVAHVLEHLQDPAAALAEIRRVLVPDGWVVMCMTRKSFLGAYVQWKWRTHRLTESVGEQWLRAAGFRKYELNYSPGGVFDLTSLSCIGQKH